MSEALIDSLNTEFTIKNNGTKEELFKIVDDLLYNLNICLIYYVLLDAK